MSIDQHRDASDTARDAKALTWIGEPTEVSIRLFHKVMPAVGALADIGGGSSAQVDHCLDMALRSCGEAMIAMFTSTGPSTCSVLPQRRLAPLELADTFDNLAPVPLVPLETKRFAPKPPKSAVQEVLISVFRR